MAQSNDRGLDSSKRFAACELYAGDRFECRLHNILDENYVGSDTILQRIKAYEAKDANGLNGFILLMHIGAGPERADKFYTRLPELINWLRSKNYQMVRIDQLLSR